MGCKLLIEVPVNGGRNYNGPETGSLSAVRTSNKSGRYFNVGSTLTGVKVSLPPAYPTQIGSKSNAKLQ